MPHVQSSRWVMLDSVKSDERKPPPHPPHSNPKPLPQPPTPKTNHTPNQPNPQNQPSNNPGQLRARIRPKNANFSLKRSLREVSGELRARIRPQSIDFS